MASRAGVRGRGRQSGGRGGRCRYKKGRGPGASAKRQGKTVGARPASQPAQVGWAGAPGYSTLQLQLLLVSSLSPRWGLRVRYGEPASFEARVPDLNLRGSLVRCADCPPVGCYSDAASEPSYALDFTRSPVVRSFACGNCTDLK